MRKKVGSSRRDPQWERGYTLIEMLIVVGIVAVLLLAAGAFALGQRNYEIKASSDRFDSLVDAARAVARSSGDGATITVVKGSGGNGFVARVLRGRPNDVLSMTYANMPALESNASIKETSDLNTEPPFAIFVNSRGNMSAAAGWIFPDSGTIAQEPTCSAAIAIQFYENGQKLQQGIAGATRGFSCAGYAAVNVPIVAIVTPGPYSTPTPAGVIDVHGTANPCPPNTLCCSTGQCTPSPTPTASPTPTPTPTPAPTATANITPSPTPIGPGTPTPTPSPTPFGSTPTPPPTPTLTPTQTPSTSPSFYKWSIVGNSWQGTAVDSVISSGTSSLPPCSGNQMQPCIGSNGYFCPAFMYLMQCGNILIGDGAATDPYASGGVCDTTPIPVVCFRHGGSGGKTPKPRTPVFIQIDATTSDSGSTWASCYVGGQAPPPQYVTLSTFFLPPGAPQILVDYRSTQQELISEIPFNCHNGEY